MAVKFGIHMGIKTTTMGIDNAIQGELRVKTEKGKFPLKREGRGRGIDGEMIVKGENKTKQTLL